jgi:hypothetical protein
VWTARKRATDPGRCPQFSFTKEQRRVSVFYVYIFDEQMGPGFIKICSYFPYPVKVWVNGHEWAKRQAAAAGIGFTALSNGFASCDNPDALQQICDRFDPGTVQVWFQRWMARLPLPLTGADQDAGFWRELSMRQVEISRTLVFDDDVHARAFFEALLRENMDLGRPESVALVFRRGHEPAGPHAARTQGGGVRARQTSFPVATGHLRSGVREAGGSSDPRLVTPLSGLGCPRAPDDGQACIGQREFMHSLAGTRQRSVRATGAR